MEAPHEKDDLPVDELSGVSYYIEDTGMAASTDHHNSSFGVQVERLLVEYAVLDESTTFLFPERACVLKLRIPGNKTGCVNPWDQLPEIIGGDKPMRVYRFQQFGIAAHGHKFAIILYESLAHKGVRGTMNWNSSLNERGQSTGVIPMTVADEHQIQICRF